jgi:hypothetical protein
MGERVGNAGPDLFRSPLKRALMRDFRDAKAMAHTLRDALKAKAIETTHSECLELISKAFGCEDWNVLSAKIQAAPSPQAGPRMEDLALKKTLYCSFCGKTQHEVKKLIAGPSPVFVCDECVGACNEVLEDEEFFDLLTADVARGDQSYPAAVEYLRGKSADELPAFLERRKKGAERHRLGLQQIARMLAMREDEVIVEGDILASPGFGFLRNKTKEDLVALQQQFERGLRGYEDAQRIAAIVLSEAPRRRE